jgi:choline/glycine/proline betaine transport protein
VVITIVSIGLLLAGSFHSMQSAVVLCGLPFSVIILLYMFGLAKALKQDQFRPTPPQVITQVAQSSQAITEKSETL